MNKYKIILLELLIPVLYIVGGGTIMILKLNSICTILSAMILILIGNSLMDKWYKYKTNS